MSSGQTPLQDPEDLAFDTALDRLRMAIEPACVLAQPEDWPSRLTAGIRAALAFAAADPAAARRLTLDTIRGRPEDQARHERLVSYLLDSLQAGREHLSDPTHAHLQERAVLAQLLLLVYHRLHHGREAELPTTALPKAIEIVLTPYVGPDEARRRAGM